MIDIVLSLCAIILLSPIFLLISVLIICSERTFKVFYVSIRIGQNGKAFKFYKFRTMKINCYEKEIFDKQKDDDRITKVGKILRRISFDELPQFLNVLKGDMSVVGNRPLPIKEASYLYQMNSKRFNAPAGITGLWQVNKSKTKNVNQRLALDVHYSKKVNFQTDMYIIYKTFSQMFKNY